MMYNAGILSSDWREAMPQNIQKTTLHKVTFRLPEDLYQAIQQTAKTDTRPINSQVIVLLREALSMRAKQPVGLVAHGSLTL